MSNKAVSITGDDPRPKAIGRIWGAAVGMLAICIPLCAILESAWLPVFVIAGAAGVTLYIWASGDRSQAPPNDETELLRAKIKELEERLANVEVINRFEDRLADKRLQQSLESPPRDATAPPAVRGSS
jgi:hypothetical protein